MTKEINPFLRNLSAEARELVGLKTKMGHDITVPTESAKMLQDWHDGKIVLSGRDVQILQNNITHEFLGANYANRSQCRNSVELSSFDKRHRPAIVQEEVPIIVQNHTYNNYGSGTITVFNGNNNTQFNQNQSDKERNDKLLGH